MESNFENSETYIKGATSLIKKLRIFRSIAGDIGCSLGKYLADVGIVILNKALLPENRFCEDIDVTPDYSRNLKAIMKEYPAGKKVLKFELN